ncbi:glutamyl-endopeptidase [Staphylococcus schleiferi]|nr:glutamyl-endopeptidase [Staphylococcus schleiferi]
MINKSLAVISAVFLTYFFIIPSAIASEDNREFVKDVFNEKGSLNTAKYEGVDSHHCTAVMLTPTVGLTAKHCKDGGFEEGNIGTVYPGESGLATEAGNITVSTFNPYSTEDIALIKGSNPTTAYSYYMKNVKLSVRGVKPSDLNGKSVYSIGYPAEKSGYKQYKTKGKITSVNGDRSIQTTLQSSAGQSGSGVFLEENDQLIGILVQGNLDGSNVVLVNSRISDWIQTKSDYSPV